MFLIDEVQKNVDTLWFKYHGDEEIRKKRSMNRLMDVGQICVMEKICQTSPVMARAGLEPTPFGFQAINLFRYSRVNFPKKTLYLISGEYFDCFKF